MMDCLPLSFLPGFLEARIEEVGAFYFITAVGLFSVVLDGNPHSLKDRAAVPISEDQKYLKNSNRTNQIRYRAKSSGIHSEQWFVNIHPGFALSVLCFPADCKDCAPALQGQRATEQCTIYALLSKGHCSIRICDLENHVVFLFWLGFYFVGGKGWETSCWWLISIIVFGDYYLLYTMTRTTECVCYWEAVSQLREKAVFQ